MSNIINLTEDEIQLIYAACMNYGNKLSNMAKDIPNESSITNNITDRAKEAWDLARKILE